MNNADLNRPAQQKPVRVVAEKKPMKKHGKRTAKRQAMNRKLNELGIDRCEIRIPGKCVDSILLSWAHSKKSRFLITDEDWMTAARSCAQCHLIIESGCHAEMERIVLEAIAKRVDRSEE